MDHSSEQIGRIRDTALQRLTQLSNSDGRPTEAFVFKDDRFCGLRFRQGLFCAQWIVGEDQIDIFRDKKLVDQVRLDPAVRRVA